MNGLTGAEATKGFILNELYEKQKKNEECGCTFGKINRERIDETIKRQDSHERFMESMSLKLTINAILTSLLALMTGAEVISRFAQWVGILK
jgi:hypothetical protein